MFVGGHTYHKLQLFVQNMLCSIHHTHENVMRAGKY
jgi:hypothetical protein